MPVPAPTAEPAPASSAAVPGRGGPALATPLAGLAPVTRVAAITPVTPVAPVAAVTLPTPVTSVASTVAPPEARPVHSSVAEPAEARPPRPVAALLDRLQVSRNGVLALAAVALLAAAVAGAGFLRSRPSALPVTVAGTAATAAGRLATVAPGAGSGAPVSGRPAGATATPAALLVVDVAGRVRRPGVVRLPAGSRVVDAVRAAGGPVPGTDLGLLNLAAKLLDGQQVVVGPAAAGAPAPAASAGGGAPATPAAQVDLNSASADDLEALPGVGPVLAQRIVDYRTAHGPFRTVDQLEDVPGIGPSKMAELRGLVTA